MKSDIRRVLSIAWWAVALSLLCGHSVAASKSLTAIIDNKSIPISINKFGVNGALLWSGIRYGDARLVDLNETLGLEFGRFPGGTIGNYYNWEAGSFSCNRATSELGTDRINSFNNTLSFRKTSYLSADFFSFIKNTDSQFSYVLNILCQTPDSNLAALQNMKDNGLQPAYIEMGNELYSPSYSPPIAGIDDYLAVVKDNYPLVKSVFPAAKVGLLVSPISFSGNLAAATDNTANPSWPQWLRDFDFGSATFPLADALIIHLYSHPLVDSEIFFSGESSDQEVYQTSIENLNKKFIGSMNYLKNLGGGKPIWVTEWGVTAAPDKRDSNFKRYLTGPYQGLYLASGLVSISLEENIEIANYHNMTDMWYAKDTTVEVTSIGKVLQLFTTAASNAIAVYSVAFQDGLGSSVESGLKSVLFVSETAAYLLVVNEQGNSYTLDNIEFSEYKITEFDAFSLHLSGQQFEANSIEGKVPTAGSKPALELRPFSVTQIKLMISGNPPAPPTIFPPLMESFDEETR